MFWIKATIPTLEAFSPDERSLTEKALSTQARLASISCRFSSVAGFGSRGVFQTNLGSCSAPSGSGGVSARFPPGTPQELLPPAAAWDYQPDQGLFHFSAPF